MIIYGQLAIMYAVGSGYGLWIFIHDVATSMRLWAIMYATGVVQSGYMNID